MTSFQVLMLVTRREIVARGKSKAFIFGTLLTIALLFAVIAMPMILDGGTDRYALGTVGDGNEEIVAAAIELGNVDPDDGGLEIDTVPFESLDAAERALDAEEVEAVLVDGAELVTPARGGVAGSGLEDTLQEAAATVRLDQAVGDATEVREILTQDALEVRSLGGTSPEDTDARVLVALGGLMLMYFAILSYGNWTLMAVTEEKTNRVAEVLLATVQPWQLLAGKIIGIGLLGLVQFVATIGMALVAIQVTDVAELPAIPVASMPTLVLWFVLGYALYAVLFGAAGALVSRMEDAQSVSTPFTIISVVGFLVSFGVIDAPTGTLARVMSIFPLTAPFAAPVRAAFEAMPWWEMAISVALMVVTITVVVRFAGRAYSGGLLQSQKVGWKDAFRSAEI